jgi:hypothetical protein
MYLNLKAIWDKMAQLLRSFSQVLYKITVILSAILMFNGLLGYLGELMKLNDFEKVSNFIFVIAQILLSLSGFTFLAELLERRKKETTEDKIFRKQIRQNLIDSSLNFLMSSFLLLFGFFLLFIPGDVRKETLNGFLNYPIGQSTLLYVVSGCSLIVSFFLFILGFYGLLGVMIKISKEAERSE